MSGAWHTISADDFLGALRRCENGEQARAVYAEMLLAAEIEQPVDGGGQESLRLLLVFFEGLLSGRDAVLELSVEHDGAYRAMLLPREGRSLSSTAPTLAEAFDALHEKLSMLEIVRGSG